jgi:restriction system protein
MANEGIFNFSYNGPNSIRFMGRGRELEWLDKHLTPRRRPVSISGVGGIGKTTLVKQWIFSRGLSDNTVWLDDILLSNPNVFNYLSLHLRGLNRSGRVVAVADGCDSLGEEQQKGVANAIFNYKVIDRLIFTSRQPQHVRLWPNLNVEPFSMQESLEFLYNSSGRTYSEAELNEYYSLSKGIPLVLRIMGDMPHAQIDFFREHLNAPVYDLKSLDIGGDKQFDLYVPRIIVDANNRIISELKKSPSDLHKLGHRQFEELLAELLRDMGWDVELTKQTRDGGADILAYINTDLGRLLCLVEAKHYNPARKVGVELVRTLYGTLTDAQANKAMLITSSSFTEDARQFQQKHKYQLGLSEYADIVEWILKYGKSK